MKLPGSFRLGAGSRHLYRHCIFTELLAETVPQSFRYSCAWELTPQGISLTTLLDFVKLTDLVTAYRYAGRTLS